MHRDMHRHLGVWGSIDDLLLPGCRYQVMADATKAMHQLDGMDIAGNKIQVKIAALSPLDASLPGAAGGAAAAMAAATQGVDLDDAVEGA